LVINEILQININQPEVVVNTFKIETVKLDNRENTGLPLQVEDVGFSDVVDCPVVQIEEELGEEVGDPHVVVANVSINSLPRTISTTRGFNFFWM
jgi:hypothetical protein